MATFFFDTCVEQIDQTAGMVWHKLDNAGPLSCAKLVKELNLPRDVIMLALGWLAREDKLQIQETNRERVLSLYRPT